MSGVTETRLKVYQATALFSVLFALVGFSYNVWRLEVTEHNSNVREASFELLLQLAELEQVVYAAHYDRDLERGSPRDGWVKVGLINDLSGTCGEAVVASAAVLKAVWSSNWAQMAEQSSATDAVVTAIDDTRAEVRAVLSTLN
ncbi:hypothetical protein EY643_04120 [Halioglobus maricola]|uniref:CHASE3 domain-containing protein n=1 Tax=Halioglobus maricola TaxID=2601894 RepID=A0A5P9NH93_9GAMM|nr:hypothetical protein [Halioglobus maricola]QFU74889.1 hypothetical protein EY643_04120 [Halioglobus maricola]